VGDEVTIRVTKNGPYYVSGPARLVDPDDNSYDLPEDKGFALCRCGHSEKKPFCDATHRKVGFESDPKAAQA